MKTALIGIAFLVFLGLTPAEGIDQSEELCHNLNRHGEQLKEHQDQLLKEALKTEELVLVPTDLMKAANSSVPIVRIAAAHFLPRVIPTDAMNILHKLLFDPDSEVRITAAASLLELKDKSGFEMIIGETNSKIDHIRLFAAATLLKYYQFSDLQNAIVAIFENMLKDENPNIRAVAVEGYAKVGNESTILKLEGLRAKESNELVRSMLDRQIQCLRYQLERARGKE